MNNFTLLSDEDLEKAILDTTEAIRLSKKLLEVASTKSVTHTLQLAAESTSKMLEALKSELQDLQAERAARR